MLYFLIYLITIVDGVKLFLLIPSSIILTVSFVFYMVMFLDNSCRYCDMEPETNKIFIKIFIACFLCLLVSSIIPDSKGLSAIIIIPKIVENKHVQNIPDKILQYSDKWLENKLSELSNNEVVQTNNK